jgi:hypothetical protein
MPPPPALEERTAEVVRGALRADDPRETVVTDEQLADLADLFEGSVLDVMADGLDERLEAERAIFLCDRVEDG